VGHQDAGPDGPRRYLRHVRAIGLLPVVATVVVPGAIVALSDDVDVGWLAIPGGALIVAGLVLWAWTVGLFATVGEGTLAPWDPTRKLVVRGPYRHVRNPMITGVIAILLGEAALLGSLSLLAWALGFFVVNAIYIPLAEEPGLVRRFGDDYLRYRENVPRWLPRPSRR
jgi:protein-S-isoprenylcysteine O-methyltransferase Ste14